MRPELGATLDHLCLRSPDPQRIARFFAEAYAMRCEPLGNGWKCEAPERVFLFEPGTANTLAFFAYAFDDEAGFERHRGRLAKGGNVSALFDDRACSAVDPDGNTVAFGVRRHRPPSAHDELPARLQHLALRTANLDAMAAFYRDELGFVVSDRVEDEQGALRACFLRTDEEHHALALFGAPAPRFDHVSCETRDTAAVIAWADRAAARRIPIHWGIGRHGPGNDVFFMVKDPDDNLVEISAEIERVAADRATGLWAHEPRTLNLWGTAIMRS